MDFPQSEQCFLSPSTAEVAVVLVDAAASEFLIKMHIARDVHEMCTRAHTHTNIHIHTLQYFVYIARFV